MSARNLHHIQSFHAVRMTCDLDGAPVTVSASFADNISVRSNRHNFDFMMISNKPRIEDGNSLEREFLTSLHLAGCA